MTEEGNGSGESSGSTRSPMVPMKPVMVNVKGVTQKQDISEMHKKNVARPHMTKGQARKVVKRKRGMKFIERGGGRDRGGKSKLKFLKKKVKGKKMKIPK